MAIKENRRNLLSHDILLANYDAWPTSSDAILHIHVVTSCLTNLSSCQRWPAHNLLVMGWLVWPLIDERLVKRVVPPLVTSMLTLARYLYCVAYIQWVVISNKAHQNIPFLCLNNLTDNSFLLLSSSANSDLVSCCPVDAIFSLAYRPSVASFPGRFFSNRPRTKNPNPFFDPAFNWRKNGLGPRLGLAQSLAPSLQLALVTSRSWVQDLLRPTLILRT